MAVAPYYLDGHQKDHVLVDLILQGYEITGSDSWISNFGEGAAWGACEGEPEVTLLELQGCYDPLTGGTEGPLDEDWVVWFRCMYYLS